MIRSLTAMQVPSKQLIFIPRKDKNFAQKIFTGYIFIIESRGNEVKFFFTSYHIDNLKGKKVHVCSFEK